MTLSCRLVAVLILAVALVCSRAEQRSTGSGRHQAANASGSAHDQGQAPARHAFPTPPPSRSGHHHHRGEAPVLPLRPLGWRTPVAAPPPPRPGTPRSRIRPYHPPPPPPPPPLPCS
ncbi:uncharacterized protein LOC133903768 [Phragmites australis]|uniref:uncharacterized protein LOC133903768 n=1 Tax=Phragmites australis TaxID=29695 RepID=UPI002D773503|nr:uncharacterized protein LOC133903768 [Phragmites australis]